MALCLCELGARLSAHAAPARPHVVRRRGEARLRAHQRVGEGLAGRAGAVLGVADVLKPLVQLRLRLGQAAGRAHGVVVARGHLLRDRLQHRAHPRGGTRELGARAVLHDPLGLGDVPLRDAHGILEGLLGLRQLAARVVHRGDEPLGLTRGLLGGPDREHPFGDLTGVQVLLRLLDRGLRELEAVPRLGAVVRHGGQGGVVVGPVQRDERSLGVRKAWPRVRHGAADPLQRLGGAGLQLPQLGEVLLLLRERRPGLPRAVDDLTEPRALVRLGVRDVVLELLLQLEGLPHVLLGAGDRLLERPCLLLAVLQLRERELLLGVLDGVVRLHECRSGLPVELRQGHQRTLRRATALLLAPRYVCATTTSLARHDHGTHAHGGEPPDRHGAQNRTATTAQTAAEGRVDALHRALGRAVPVTLVQCGGNVIGVDLLSVAGGEWPGGAGQESCLASLCGHRQHGVIAAETVVGGELLRPLLRIGGIREALYVDHVERDLVFLGQGRDRVLQRGGVTERVR